MHHYSDNSNVPVGHCTAPGTLGNLTSHLCWAWSAGSENMHRGYFNHDREEPLLTLNNIYLHHIIRSASHHISSWSFTPLYKINSIFKTWLIHIFISYYITSLYHIKSLYHITISYIISLYHIIPIYHIIIS